MKAQSAEAKKHAFLDHFTRRNFFKGMGFMSLTSMANCGGETSNKPTLELEIKNPRIPIPTYESIGATPIVNLVHDYTTLGGCLMPPEVKMAMLKAAEQYVQIDDLMYYVGKRLSELTGAEWGAIFPGAAACLAASALACMVGSDPERRMYPPHTEGLKNECICRSYRGYGRAIWSTGMKMIVARNREEAEAAVNEKTSMMFGGSDYIIEVGNKYNIPILVDRAALGVGKPIEDLERGADLVAVSGGKIMRGPQPTGLLFGRKDLVDAAFLNMYPHHSFGRICKLGKEEIMGCLAAVDLYINGTDQEALRLEWKRSIEYINEQITQIPTVTTKVNPPRGPLGYWSLDVGWDQNTIKISSEEVAKQLLNGTPRIFVRIRGDHIYLETAFAQEGDEIVGARRLKEIFSSAM